MVDIAYSALYLFHSLSVLALSSRFDGRINSVELQKRLIFFQYSLCRVVLMVK